jgi:twitching motility protein PilU
MIDMHQLLSEMRRKGGTDLFLCPGASPTLKIKQSYEKINVPPLDQEQVKDLIFSLLKEKHQQELLEHNEANVAIEYASIGRFRLSAYVQKSRYSGVIRMINDQIPTLESLGLPPYLNKLIEKPSGLIIVSGPAGAGKSSTVAALLNYRNEHFPGHIICIEDPIEYLHQHKLSIVSQREVGDDTASYDIALQNCLRQAPSVLMIGEIRAPEVMEKALHFAETGHLCIATIHANSTYQALECMANFFRDKNRDNMLMNLSLNLQGIICQKLLPTTTLNNVVPALEIMLYSAAIADRIRRGQFSEISEFISKNKTMGMQTFDQALIELHQAGQITQEMALRYANSENDVRLQIKLNAPKKSKDLK